MVADVLADGYGIRPLEAGDGPALAAAYERNRDHLAPWDPARPEEFYTAEGQSTEVADRLQAVATGQGASWVLVRGEEVVGRVNLNNLIRGVLQSASVGYWVDAAHTGLGLATAMVDHALAAAANLGLHRVEAGTMLANEPSQRVLARAGFDRIGVAREFLFIAGDWQDHVLFQRILHRKPLESSAVGRR
jgi:ribosomal-protein-alanine N-acetyltransferase